MSVDASRTSGPRSVTSEFIMVYAEVGRVLWGGSDGGGCEMIENNGYEYDW